MFSTIRRVYCSMSILLLLVQVDKSRSLLFPQESESREVKFLNGLWTFRIDNSTSRDASFEDKWYEEPLEKSGEVIFMPVPSSYNDVTQDRNIRDFVGWAWYETFTFVPRQWGNEYVSRTVLRFESCHYYCIVYINGEKAFDHEGGHLPFEEDIGNFLEFGGNNRITVAVNNTLTPETLPPGSIKYYDDKRRYPPNYFVQELQMDFFNYAGIHRPVKLYRTPVVYLSDVQVVTDFNETTGYVKFNAIVGAIEGVDENDIIMEYELSDMNDEVVANVSGKELFEGKLMVKDVNLWWPVGMDKKPGYLYSLRITTTSSNGTQDFYRLSLGIRTVEVKKTDFLINGVPFYFKGFGMHEDSNSPTVLRGMSLDQTHTYRYFPTDFCNINRTVTFNEIRGKGLDLPLIMKDFNLIKWMSANAFRTSHYPYADEIMDLADRQGIVVIDECPAVGLEKENMKPSNLNLHKKVIKELIRRDKNHPAVVMWSVANEPRSDVFESREYFKSIAEYTRGLDSNRPITLVSNQRANSEKAMEFFDVCSINRYYGWYHDCGHIELIQRQFDSELNEWFQTFRKPIIQMEYGADTVAGMHQIPSFVFSEEYQVDTIKEYFPVFDKYRETFLVGEMIWNFADFMTAQDITRVLGNKKGIFTRERQPKMAAHVLRNRYKDITNEDTAKQENNVLVSLIRE